MGRIEIPMAECLIYVAPSVDSMRTSPAMMGKLSNVTEGGNGRAVLSRMPSREI